MANEATAAKIHASFEQVLAVAVHGAENVVDSGRVSVRCGEIK